MRTLLSITYWLVVSTPNLNCLGWARTTITESRVQRPTIRRQGINSSDFISITYLLALSTGLLSIIPAGLEPTTGRL